MKYWITTPRRKLKIPPPFNSLVKVPGIIATMLTIQR
jgi:hypothetical protein